MTMTSVEAFTKAVEDMKLRQEMRKSESIETRLAQIFFFSSTSDMSLITEKS